MINVLVIDDSAVMRTFLSQVINAQPDMRLAGVVSDPLLAIERIRRTAPDVITLDVEMPRMNGLDFLRKLMAVRPLPVLMISSLTQEGADATFRALELGAVDFFPKPASLDELARVSQDIAEKIRAAAQARVVRASAGSQLLPAPAAPQRPRGRMAVGTIIGIGASTGGVEALRAILTELPAQMPPILMAQHMLPGFTETFARRLDAISALSVRQACDGDEAVEGTVYVAPGGRHLLLARESGRYLLRVTDDAAVNRHRPSVDALFMSMARTAGAQAIGLLMTGMGADGAEGLLAMRHAGAITLAQDEASSIVFGMPRQAIALGAAQEVIGLTQVAARLRALTQQSSPEN
ncbi:MAG: chemotaxis response regulator protein-glutamate methylesterase [Polaromonas sp.]|uniref:protein-glutamate methylesterase/protein-glutamine glutaminase n=1 Tax=Polaromonas sp. TaxID=1869339 RepID=UPI001800E9AF|nr:chemotaxis response regulator protein-glutamate methylesterase [Polaromonas sp.]MBA3593628.1 chemotaxis response regulator protein-glutamate methylesterase [Polaromonas sp.]